MSEPLRIQIEASTLQDWKARLQQIAEPTVRYNEDRSVMQDRVIEQNAEIAKALLEEIKGRLGPPCLPQWWRSPRGDTSESNEPMGIIEDVLAGSMKE